MRLTTQGLVDEDSSDEGLVCGLVRPDRASTLLRYWYRTLEDIEEGYTFGDLISLLRGVDDIAVLSPLLACDVVAFLVEADHPRREADEEPIEFVRVHNVLEPQRYEPDPSQPDEHLEWMDGDAAAEYDRVAAGLAAITGEPVPKKIIDATEDDPITSRPMLRRLRAPAMHGRWMAPYSLHREFSGWGKWTEPYAGYFAQHPEIDRQRYMGAFALDFTPISQLLHLPLKYDPAVVFRSVPALGAEEVLYETQMTTTFGEFLHAVFWELGFFGTPEGRDETWRIVDERAAAIRPSDDPG